ncbi:reverse transcriptase [Gossypium australe]|uniref:Reverse transcriptase n=1 Tax=Gossypium australe TaxID=47621 RepID=A0A5B6V9C1_9ROSI|nr:reverse transcriptase [Gossypium australe]
MKLLSWNVRGLGSPRSVKRLRHMLKAQNPQVVFFMETKVCRSKMERNHFSCGYVIGIDVDPEGTRRGLCLAWKQEVSVKLRQFSKRYIDVVIDGNNLRGKWRFTGFYGSPYEHDRNNSWADLKNLYIEERVPWLVREKNEGFLETKEEWSYFERFYQIVVLWIWVSLEDGLHGKEEIYRRQTYVSGLTGELQTEIRWQVSTKRAEQGAKEAAFRFEAWWTMEESFDEEVKIIWESSSDERYWEQRARINWLKYGDRNTAFFHYQATQRRRRNMIHKMQDENGRETEISQDIKDIPRSYFQKLFRSEEMGRSDHLLSGIEKCITEEDNHQLTMPYTKEEIKAATFEMGPTKAPEEDGLHALFYQKCWHIVSDAVIKFCLQTLNEGKDFK